MLPAVIPTARQKSVPSRNCQSGMDNRLLSGSGRMSMDQLPITLAPSLEDKNESTESSHTQKHTAKDVDTLTAVFFYIGTLNLDFTVSHGFTNCYLSLCQPRPYHITSKAPDQYTSRLYTRKDRNIDSYLNVHFWTLNSNPALSLFSIGEQYTNGLKSIPKTHTPARTKTVFIRVPFRQEVA